MGEVTDDACLDEAGHRGQSRLAGFGGGFIEFSSLNSKKSVTEPESHSVVA